METTVKNEKRAKKGRETERERGARKKWRRRGLIAARKVYEFLRELVHRQPPLQEQRGG